MRFILLLITAVSFAADPSIGKKLTFSDDFNGEKIDETKWNLPANGETAFIVKGGKGQSPAYLPA